jgi:hypothetical protein
MMPGENRMNVEAFTVAVNAHGGLLEARLKLAPFQKIRLSNLKTEVVAVCKVVRVEASQGGRFSIAFEFESPSPRIWPISFPPKDWTPAL